MGRNAWNDFQRANAGQGLSRQQMSAMYQEAKSTGNVYKPSYNAPYVYAEPRAPSQVAPASTWNSFQQAYAGLGLSRQEVSALYQASKKASQLSTASAWTRQDAPSWPSNHQSSQGIPPVQEQTKSTVEVTDAARQAKESATQTSSTASHSSMWSEFLRKHACERISKVRMWWRFVEECKKLASKGPSSSRPSGDKTITTGQFQKKAKYDASGDAIDISRLELVVDDAHRIGSGALGIVYVGLLDNTVPVAVKIVDGVSATSKARFKQELKALIPSSQHENILRVHGYVVLTNANGHESYGIVTELMDGEDLALAIHRDDSNALLDELDRLNLLLQVIKSIEHLHAQGITHRDIKPQNVLLSSDYKTAKLADFGLAGVKIMALATRQSSMTIGDSAAVGRTPAYTAPEVIEGKLSFHDAAWKKSDVFSFTVMLAQILTGEQPWDLETPHFVMNAVSKQQKRPFDPERIILTGDEVATGKIRSLVRDGWQQDPEIRPTASEMRERLEQIIAIRRMTRAATQSLCLHPDLVQSSKETSSSPEFHPSSSGDKLDVAAWRVVVRCVFWSVCLFFFHQNVDQT